MHHKRFLILVILEEALCLPFLAWAYSMGPAGSNERGIALFVAAYGLGIAISDTLIYMMNRRVIWKHLHLASKLARIIAAIVMTDAVFYAIYSAIINSTGLWLTAENPYTLPIALGVGLGITGTIISVAAGSKADTREP